MEVRHAGRLTAGTLLFGLESREENKAGDPHICFGLARGHQAKDAIIIVKIKTTKISLKLILG
jgi:hypothetical protein